MSEIERLKAEVASLQERLAASLEPPGVDPAALARTIDSVTGPYKAMVIDRDARIDALRRHVERLEAVLGVLDLTCSNEAWKAEHHVACGTCPECVALALLAETRKDL